VHLAQLTIKNFRRIAEATLLFRPGLNVIVGPNNIGKTAVVDGLRALLAGVDDPYPRFTLDDIHLPKGGAASGEIRFEYVFRGLSLDDEAEFIHALRERGDGTTEAVMGVTYGDADKSGRLKPRRWCGDFNEIAMTCAMPSLALGPAATANCHGCCISYPTMPARTPSRRHSASSMAHCVAISR
jgi:putative ATP-dependent endonuclease of OLD family